MFFIFAILIILGIIILNSKIQIRINNLDIATDRKEKIRKNFEIYLGIIIFNKKEILKINLKNIKKQKMDFKKILEQAKKIDKKMTKTIKLKKIIKNLKFEIKEINLKIGIGTEDASVTAISVGTISAILGILLKEKKFKVSPIYEDRNVLKIKLNGIFRIDLIHYIYKTILKGRDKNERKPSNRRTYAHINE